MIGDTTTMIGDTVDSLVGFDEVGDDDDMCRLILDGPRVELDERDDCSFCTDLVRARFVRHARCAERLLREYGDWSPLEQRLYSQFFLPQTGFVWSSTFSEVERWILSIGGDEMTELDRLWFESGYAHRRHDRFPDVCGLYGTPEDYEGFYVPIDGARLDSRFIGVSSGVIPARRIGLRAWILSHLKAYHRKFMPCDYFYDDDDFDEKHLF